MKRSLLFYMIILCLFDSCNESDTEYITAIDSEIPMRVKRIVGKNASWGDYELKFTYKEDGRLQEVVRYGTADDIQKRNIQGIFSVEYDLNYFHFTVKDRVLNIDSDSVARLASLYPDTYMDTLQHRQVNQVLYFTELKEGRYVAHLNKPRDNKGHGSKYNTNYYNVSATTQIVENGKNGRPLVIRCYNDRYYDYIDNNKYKRTVLKYEFQYDKNETVAVDIYKPDSYNDESWTKTENITFSYYSGVLIGAEGEHYKMRRSGNTVVIAEPGVNTTYRLNEYGLAEKMESTAGDVASIEYEKGIGNFSELYTTPLDRSLGKIWIK